MDPIFNRDGRMVGWLQNRVIYDKSGGYRAFLRKEAVHSFRGNFLGHLDQGYFRDWRGDAVAFLKGAKHGPALPFLETALPLTQLRIPSFFPMPSYVPVQVMPSFCWSSLDWDSYLVGVTASTLNQPREAEMA